MASPEYYVDNNNYNKDDEDHGDMDDDDDDECEDDDDECEDEKGRYSLPSAFCSVLNVVIDHTMESVSPMEPKEWKEYKQWRRRNHRPKRMMEKKTEDPNDQMQQQQSNGDGVVNDEDKDSYDQPPLVQVPVLRVFGPLLRNANNSGNDTPIQSACVHIHGAFPYLLARPVLAGPYGSLHRGGQAGGRRRRHHHHHHHIDWDDRYTIESIARDIHAILEEAVQSLFDNFSSNDSKHNNRHEGHQRQQKKYRVIRKVTVVEGRGFYGYCPGPPAPFLKIEYYDPKLRWKVKLVLEKGLAVPLRYHPDPYQYNDRGEDKDADNADGSCTTDTSARMKGTTTTTTTVVSEQNTGICDGNDDDFDDDDDEDDGWDTSDTPLKFRCYEAHVPYTMQFFKDYNLAGMSYVHIQKGKIRGRLPSSYQSTIKNKHIRLRRDEGQDDHDNNENNKDFDEEERLKRSMFLVSNTPDDCMWSKPQTTMAQNENDATPLSPQRRMAHNENANTPLSPQREDNGESPGKVPDTPLRQPSQESTFNEVISRIHKDAEGQVDDDKNGDTHDNDDDDDSMDCDDEDDDFDPPQRITSCDVELDCSVRNILNVLAVMTSMPSDQEERDKIHWRAVPSLQEWWRQEERRLKKYLAPSLTQEIMTMMSQKTSPLEDDAFEPSPFKLNIKSDSSPRSGTRLAVKGMWSLINVTAGLQEDFVRSMTDILFRHREAIAKVDQELLTREMTKKATGITNPGEGFRTEFTPPSRRRQSTATPTITEAVDALESLANADMDTDRCQPSNSQESDSLGGTANTAIFSPDVDDDAAIVALDSMAAGNAGVSDEVIDERSPIVQHADTTPTKRLFGPSLSQGTFSQSQDYPYYIKEIYDAFEMSQRLERGESIMDHGEDIDPETLRPYDEHEREEEDEDVEALEKFLSQSHGHFQNDDMEKSKTTSVSKSTQSTPRRVRFAENLVAQSTTKNHGAESPAIGRNFEAVHADKNNNSDVEDFEVEKEETEDDINKYEKTRLEQGDQKASASSTGVFEAEDARQFKGDYQGLSLDGIFYQPTGVPPSRKKVAGWTRQTQNADDVFSRKRKKRYEARLEIDSTSRQIVPVARTELQSTGNLHMADQENIEVVAWEPSQQLTPTQPSQEESVDATPEDTSVTPSQNMKSPQDSVDPLEGIGAQGGKIHVQGGGALKAKTRSSQLTTASSVLESAGAMGRSNFFSTPVSIMSVEIHVQCREGDSRLGSKKKIAMTPDSNKDKIVAILYVFARDPGGGESLDILSRGCILTTLEGENPRKESTINDNVQRRLMRELSRSSFGIVCPAAVEVVKDERQLLLRFKDIVRNKDPDVLLSWDMQGAGVGYIIERGVALRRSSQNGSSIDASSGTNASIDMVKLLGRTPRDTRAACYFAFSTNERSDNSESGRDKDKANNKPTNWTGSGLGSDWDDRVGPGAAAASIVGRLAFSAWKTVAEEVKHGNASYQPAIVAAVLGKRIPHHNDLTLTKWFASQNERRKVLEHRFDQATACLLLFTDALDIIGRAGEAARLSGVTFAESFPGVRGSQYKVEGVLLRGLQSLRSDERGSKKGKSSKSGTSSQRSISSGGSSQTKSQTQSPWKLRRQNNVSDGADESAHVEDRQYFFFSPSLDDTNKQEALEVQALTLEPVSGHYTDPVVVCDFTALYPSLIIAYNLCYSTCAGRLEYHSTRREMRMEGTTRGRVGPFNYSELKTATILSHHMKSISRQTKSMNTDFDESKVSRDRAYVAPTGAIYVGENVVKGVLPQVLDEILTTRAMLKREMKELKKSGKPVPPAVYRQLEARQLALKYVANVTYGYTSATFSGRCAMPTLADTIVELARRTLRRAIDVANQWGKGKDPWGRADDRWCGACVVYGDTDSLFVKLPGRSHQKAFAFGEELCAAVTSLNPPPVQLKLEKVYWGCILQTMKRYGGMKYESKDQKKPVFEAKGLETVRRDQCRLTQEILKNVLIMLFRHGLGQVREYLNRQWSLILRDELPVSYFILTGRVRSQYRGGREGPVQAVLSRRLAETDPGRIVKHKERVPYVIAAIPGKNFTLKDCVLTPMEMLEGWDAYKINARYYIEKLVNAALNRCLKLAPHYVNIDDWYRACPKPRRRVHIWPVKSNAAMITAFFGFDICSLCQQKCYADGSKQVVVCNDCRMDPTKSILVAARRLNQVEEASNLVAQECANCNGCFESADTFAVVQNARKESSGIGGRRKKTEQIMLLPLANCVCIDCPNTFRRHRLREQGLEFSEAFNSLTL